MSSPSRLVVVATLCAALVWPAFGVAAAQDTGDGPADSGAEPVAAAPPEITAAGAVLWEPATGAWLFEREAAVGRPMASTTKIMTVMLALEAGVADEVVTVSNEAARVGARPGGASLGLRAGQEVPMTSLLAGLLQRSGNGAAVAVAEHVAGSEAAFVDRMNARADELGLVDTSFVNSSGLTDDVAHHASPRDLARLAEVAMADERFALWAGAATWEDPVFGSLTSRNELLGSFPGATGVKTGYTSLAGLCLVASATRDGRTLYAVVLNSEDSFGDAAALLAHGFEDHRVAGIAADAPLGEFRWADTAVSVAPLDGVSVTVVAGADVEQRLELRPLVDRPAPAGTVAGTVVLEVDGIEVARTDAVLAADVVRRDDADPAAAAGAAIGDVLLGLTRVGPMDQAR